MTTTTQVKPGEVFELITRTITASVPDFDWGWQHAYTFEYLRCQKQEVLRQVCSEYGLEVPQVLLETPRHLADYVLMMCGDERIYRVQRAIHLAMRKKVANNLFSYPAHCMQSWCSLLEPPEMRAVVKLVARQFVVEAPDLKTIEVPRHLCDYIVSAK